MNAVLWLQQNWTFLLMLAAEIISGTSLILKGCEVIAGALKNKSKKAAEIDTRLEEWSARLEAVAKNPILAKIALNPKMPSAAAPPPLLKGL